MDFEAKLNEMFAAIEPLSPKRFTARITERDGSVVYDTKVPFLLVKIALRSAKLGEFAREHAGNLSYSDVSDLVREIDVDAVLAELRSGGVTLPYTLVEVTDAFGRHAVATLE